MKHIHHIHIYILIGSLAVVAILLLANFLLEQSLANQPVIFGVSYSPRFAQEIGLDPQKTYLDILNSHIKHIRLSAYWDEIEPSISIYNFGQLDWYIDQAQKNKAQVILTVGYKLPRWPECRAPSFISNLSDLRASQLKMVERVISYYEQNPTIVAFQIENEPLLSFGICPAPDPIFFEKEIKKVRNLTQKPIIITDSGELRNWIEPMRKSDIFGTTLYRKVSNPFFGDFFYPLPPGFYRLKSGIIRKLFAPQNQETIVAELQAELWAGAPLSEIPIEDQIEKFPLNQFKSNVEYAKRTGFKSFYLWGAEWWYYLAQNGHPEYLEYAKTLFYENKL